MSKADEKEVGDEERRFENFINKTIIMSSKRYFKKEANTNRKEQFALDDEDILHSFRDTFNNEFFGVVDDKLELNNAITVLSEIEQSVIFLLFFDDLSQDEAAQILKICSNSISRIKIRALKKMKKFLKGDSEDGE